MRGYVRVVVTVSFLAAFTMNLAKAVLGYGADD